MTQTKHGSLQAHQELSNGMSLDYGTYLCALRCLGTIYIASQMYAVRVHSTPFVYGKYHLYVCIYGKASCGLRFNHSVSKLD